MSLKLFKLVPIFITVSFAIIMLLTSFIKIVDIIINNEPLGLPAEDIWIFLFLICVLPTFGPQDFQAGFQAGWRYGWGKGMYDVQWEEPKTGWRGNWQDNWPVEWRERWKAGRKAWWQAGWQHESARLGVKLEDDFGSEAEVGPEGSTVPESSAGPTSGVDAEGDTDLEVRAEQEAIQQRFVRSEIQNGGARDGKRGWWMRKLRRISRE